MVTAARLQRLLVLGGLGIAVAVVCIFSIVGGPRWGLVAGVGIAALYPAVLALELSMAAVVGRQAGGRPPSSSSTPWYRFLFAWIGEIGAGMRTFFWNQPFRTESERDAIDTPLQGRRGVILVHGLLCNRAFWNRWMRRLRAEGDIPFIAVTLEPLFCPIEAYSATFEAAVCRITDVTGKPPVVVGHSMGGLVVRHWLMLQTAPDRVHRVITIGTPHRGTWLARFARSQNARQMAVDSDWLQCLQAAGRRTDVTRFTCYYSDCDNVVFPPVNATLRGADNRLLAGLGHVQLADQPVIFAEVLRCLREAPLADSLRNAQRTPA